MIEEPNPEDHETLSICGHVVIHIDFTYRFNMITYFLGPTTLGMTFLGLIYHCSSMIMDTECYRTKFVDSVKYNYRCI